MTPGTSCLATIMLSLWDKIPDPGDKSPGYCRLPLREGTNDGYYFFSGFFSAFF
jgi:hypothetical protein